MDAAKSSTAVMPRHPQKANPTTNAAPESIMAALVRATSEGPIVGPPSAEEHSINTTHETDPIVAALQQLVLPSGGANSLPVFTSLPSGYLQPSSPATASAAAAAGKADDEGASADGDNCIFAEPISVRLRPRVRELNLLLALLQRPREAFMWARPYRTLMLACQNEGFPKMILEDLATCWAAGWGSSTSSAALSAEEDDLHPRSRFMSLCSECLFLYHQHLRASANSDTSSQREASFSPEHLAQCLSLASQLTTTTTTSAAHGGGDVVASELQRCALLLCSIVVQDLHAVPLSALEAAEERLCQMSSTTSVDGIVKPPLTQLPIILSILSHSHDEGWTRRACATLTHTTIASYDVSVLLRRDGGDAPLHPLIKEIFGTAFYALWASLHTCVWRSCTDASLMSVAHNFCMYAYTWPSTPAAVVGMVELVQERLMELTQAARDVQHMSIEDEDGRRLTTAQASSSVHVQGLLESAVAGSGGDASALAAYKHEQMSGGGGAPSSQPSSRGGVDARAAARRYLSMYGFCLAALAYTCSSLEELFPLFAGPPTATSTTSTTSSAMDGEVVDVRDDGYARWLPMPVRWIHVQSNKTHCINLVAQFLDYLCFLAPSPQLNRPSGMAVGEEEEAATTTTTTTTTTNEAKNATQSHFFNASLAVLHALCTNYPQDLSRLRELSGQNVLDLIVSLTLAYLNVSGPTPFAQAILFSLTERFYTAFPPALLQLRVLPADATNHLYASEEEMGNAIMQLAIFRSMHERQRQLSDGTFFSLSRFLTVLAEVEAGVITTTTNGGIFFVRLLSHLLESMEMQGTTVSGLLMDLPEPQRVREVVARLFEGVACLWRQHEAGYAYLYNSSTTTLLAFTIRIITDMAHLTRRYDMCATCLIPACGGGGDFFFSAIFVLLHIAYAPDTSLMLATAVSELLCSTITHSAPQGIFATLRPHTTKRYRVRLSNLMHASLTRGIGSISNRLRLLIMLELTRVEPVVMQYFITLDGHPSTSEAMQVEDLRMTKVLTSIVVREESSMVEKALALDLLRWMGMSAAVKPNRAIGLLQRQDGAQDEEVLASGHDLALTAAVVQYANARMQEQASKALRTADGSGGASREPMTAVMKKIVASQGDSIDLCIRRGTECLVAATRRCRDAGRAMMFEDLTQDRTGPIQHAVYSEAACQRWQPRGAPACATWTQRCARGTSFAEWQREVEHLADAEDCTGMSSTIRSMMPSGGTGPTTATTATTAAAGGAAGASAIVASNSTSSPAVAAAARLRTELLPDASATQHRFRRAFQLLLGDEYCFLGTDNDVAYNYAVSQLEMMGELCAALENLTWMVAAQGTDLVPMVLHRTGELLAAAIRCGGLVDCYTAPMIQPMVGSMVMRALNLASAAASLLDVARVPGAEEMEDRVGINHIMAELLGWMSRHGSLRVVSHGISTLAKVMHSPQKPEDAITLTNAFELLMRTLGHHATSMELNEMNVVVESCARLVARWGEYCPLHVFASITSTLVHRALFLASQHIVAHAPSTDDPATLHFIRIIHCLRSMMIYRGAEVRMTCLLPQEDVLRLVRGFGASRSSTIAPTSPGADYTRQAWHVCWCAVLELLRVLLITSGTSDASMAATGWMGPLHATLSTTPRFLLALGGFGELPEKERRFFIWDVKEMKRCTEVAALIAMQASLPSRLLVCVQQCFCMASTYPIRRLCLCTTSSPPVAAEEVQVMKAAFVRLVRSQLTILMKQPIFILAPVGSLVLRPALAFPREGAALTTPTSIDDVLRSDSYGFDVLQKYITQELRVIRSLSRGEGKTGGEGGTPASTTAPPAAAVTPATTSATASTTRECSQSRPSGNLAETDTITTESAAEVGGDGHQGPLSAAQYRALHAENTQLALSLFMSGAHEVWRLENAASATTGLALTPAFFAEVRNTCDRLQNTLSSLRDDVKKMGSPNLIRVVESMRHQLQSAVSSLQY